MIVSNTQQRKMFHKHNVYRNVKRKPTIYSTKLATAS